MRTDSSAHFVARLIARRQVRAVVTSGSSQRPWLLGSALALCCASSFMVSGCARGSKDVSANLREEASKAAIKAQDEIETERRERAIAASDPKSKTPAGKKSPAAASPPALASKEPRSTPGAASRTAESGSTVAAASRQRSNPLAEYLRAEEAEASAAKSSRTSDPFLAQTVTSPPPKVQPRTAKTGASQADAEWESLLEEKLAQARARHGELPDAGAIAQVSRTVPSETSTVATRRSTSGPGARPFPGMSAGAAAADAPVARPYGAQPAQVIAAATTQQPSLSAELASAAPDWSTDSSQQSVDFNGSQNIFPWTQRETGPSQTAAVVAIDESQQLARVEPAQSKQDRLLPSKDADNAPTEPLVTRVEPRGPTINNASEKSAATAGPLDAGKLRVQALLSQARSQLEQGAVHEAFNSAKEAQRVADEHHVAFASGEEVPSVLAMSIADRLWGMGLNQPALATAPLPEQPDPRSSLAATDAFSQPAIEAERNPVEDARSSELFASVFGNTQQPPQWQATQDIGTARDLPGDLRSQLPGFAGNSWTAPSEAEPTLAAAPAVDPFGSSFQEKRSVETVADDAAAQASWNSRLHEPAGDRSPIVLTHIEAEPEEESRPYPSLTLPAPFEERASSQDDFDTAMLPPPLPSDTPELPEIAKSRTSRAAVEPEMEVETAVADQPEPSNNLAWAMLGFVAAALSTLMGLRVHRSKQPEESAVERTLSIHRGDDARNDAPRSADRPGSGSRAA